METNSFKNNRNVLYRIKNTPKTTIYKIFVVILHQNQQYNVYENENRCKTRY